MIYLLMFMGSYKRTPSP